MLTFSIYSLQGVPKNLLESGHSTLLFHDLVLFFSGCLTRGVINAARIVLLDSTIKLNNLSSCKKHDL